MNFSKIHETRKGVASLYAVIFATILFGVITLSFIRIILSEARQSDDDELSQSAYDSALAGIEDAKRAVNNYYACLNNGGGSSCIKPFDAECKDFAEEKSKLKTALNTVVRGEIKIQEASLAKGKSSETSVDQAYTCLTMSDETDDYRSTLSSDTRVRVVPLGISSSNLGSVKSVELEWFSENNSTQLTNLYSDKSLQKQGRSSNAPVISLTLLHTGPDFRVSDFNNSTADNYSTMILLPSDSKDATNEINSSAIRSAGNSDTRNEPFLIKCQQGEFACKASLKTDGLFQTGGNAFLVVSMPYGETISDFAVTMRKDNGESIKFQGAQISVDSTGRANQLYRRIETRLDPADNYFPYPQYAIELNGEGTSKLLKNFWITYNCWTEAGPCNNNGDIPD